MADHLPLPTLFVACRQCGQNMVEGWLGADPVDSRVGSRRANLIWIDKDDDGMWTDLTAVHFLKPPKVHAYRCDRCGIVELHFPEGFLANTMRQGFPSE